VVQAQPGYQAVKRNLDRFPEDFMLQLTAEEWAALRSQSVISNVGRGGRRYAPYAFTEQGVAMLSTVLNSKRAIRWPVRLRGSAVTCDYPITFVYTSACIQSETRYENRQSIYPR
jgi:hypothetical protein